MSKLLRAVLVEQFPNTTMMRETKFEIGETEQTF